MRVRVDQERCEGHGRCYAVAPEVFEPDDVGNGHEIGDGVVPPDLEHKARLGANNCPERAVVVEDAGPPDGASASSPGGDGRGAQPHEVEH
jgi:ferredoxin